MERRHTGLKVYLEIAPRRVFAGAIEWPGWDRGGRDERAALDALLAAGPRYKRDLGAAARGLSVPATVEDLEVVERRDGDSGTEFGIPSLGPSRDGDPVDEPELGRLALVLEAAWQAFDMAAAGAEGAELRKGPRGGGRDLDGIVEHVLAAQDAYVREIGGRARIDTRGDPDGHAALRAAALAALSDRAHGVPVEMGRRTRPLWTPRYFVRRSAWHALDHAWEIEDRRVPG